MLAVEVGETSAQLLLAEHSLCAPPVSLLSSVDFDDEVEVDEQVDLMRTMDAGDGADTMVADRPSAAVERFGPITFSDVAERMLEKPEVEVELDKWLVIKLAVGDSADDLVDEPLESKR